MSTTAPDDRITDYTPVSPTTEFPALFPVFDDSDLIVIHDGVERTDFTVTASYIDGVSNDAKAVFATGLTGVVLVVGARSPRRSNRFSNGPLPVRDQNLALDTLEAEIQEVRRDVGRAIKAGYGEEAQAFPDPDENSLIGWVDGRLENRPAEGASAAVAQEAAERAEEAREAAEAAAAAFPEPVPFLFVGNGTLGPYDVGAAMTATSSILLFVDGVKQSVGLDFTFSGTQITFVSLVPTSSNSISGVIFAARAIGKPAPGSVSETELNAFVGEVLDPLRGFHPDASVDDTARFTALRQNPVLEHSNVDLRNGRYKATSFPTGWFRNGYFSKPNAIGAMTLDYPAFDTISSDSMRLTQGALYQGHYQDKCHSYKEVVYAPHNFAPSHGSTSGGVKMDRSLDGGQSFCRHEIVNLPASGRATSWSAGVYNGQQFVVIQTEDSGGVLQSIKLFARRLFEFWEQEPLRIQTFNGQPTARAYLANAGVKPGDIFRAVSGFGTIAGVAVNGNFTITDCRNSYFEFSLGSNANLDTDETYTARFGFPEGTFAEMLFGGSAQDFGTFLVANSSLGSLPTMVHSFAARRLGSVDCLYFGISSGSTDAILKITNIFRPTSSRAFGYMKQLPNAGPNVSEPTVCTDGNSLFGFLRHQNAPDTGSAYFWWSDDDLTTVTSYALPAGRAVAYLSPIPVRAYGDYLIAFATGDRLPEVTGGTTVPLYMMISTKVGAKSASWGSWTSIHLGPLPRTKAPNSNIGVPSIAIAYNKAFVFYGAEEAPQSYPATEQGTIANGFCLAIDLDFLVGGIPYEEFVGPLAIKPARLAAIVIESGTETNGDRWEKYSDGTMKCFSRPLPSGQTNGTTGNVFTSADLTWTYPMQFFGSPLVTGSTRRTGGNGVGWLGNLDLGASSTTYTYRVLSSANDHQANSYLKAEGRWF